MTVQILWTVEPEWKRKRDADSTLLRAKEEVIKICSFVWADTDLIFYFTQRRTWSTRRRTLIEEAEKWHLDAKTRKFLVDQRVC